MDPTRSTTDPARTKRDQGLGLGLGIEQGLGLGIVPVPASDGSRGHWRARRREEVRGEGGERVADAATPTRRERRARQERSGRDGAAGESRERGERVRANELGRRSETRPASRDGRFYTPYSNGRIQRCDGSEAGDPTVTSRAAAGPAHIACLARAGTTGQNGGPGTALRPGRARHWHEGRRARPFLGRAI